MFCSALLAFALATRPSAPDARPEPEPTPLAALPEALLSPSVTALLARPARAVPFAQQDDGGEPGTLLRYTYIEVGALDYGIDSLNGSDPSLEAWYGRASLNLGFLYLFGGYENQSADLNNTDANVVRLGLGGHVDPSPKLSVLGEINWLWNDVTSDLSQFDASSNGYEVRGGARWMPIRWNGGGIELDGNLLYVDVDNRVASDDQAWGWEAGGRVHFLNLVSVGGQYTQLEDDDQVALNLRLSF